MRNVEKTTREKSKIYIKRALKEIKRFPVKHGYYVVKGKELAEYIGYYPAAISGFLKLLEKKGLIETKRSAWRFGSMRVVGIKILESENDD